MASKESKTSKKNRITKEELGNKIYIPARRVEMRMIPNEELYKYSGWYQVGQSTTYDMTGWITMAFFNAVKVVVSRYEDLGLLPNGCTERAVHQRPLHIWSTEMKHNELSFASIATEVTTFWHGLLDEEIKREIWKNKGKDFAERIEAIVRELHLKTIYNYTLWEVDTVKNNYEFESHTDYKEFHFALEQARALWLYGISVYLAPKFGLCDPEYDFTSDRLKNVLNPAVRKALFKELSTWMHKKADCKLSWSNELATGILCAPDKVLADAYGNLVKKLQYETSDRMAELLKDSIAPIK